MVYAFVLIVGLAAGALGGVIGPVSSIALLPVLVCRFGPKQAVPIMAIAAYVECRQDRRVVARDRLAGVRVLHAARNSRRSACARALLIPPSHVVDIALGMVFLAMIPPRH